MVQYAKLACDPACAFDNMAGQCQAGQCPNPAPCLVLRADASIRGLFSHVRAGHGRYLPDTRVCDRHADMLTR